MVISSSSGGSFYFFLCAVPFTDFKSTHSIFHSQIFVMNLYEFHTLVCCLLSCYVLAVQETVASVRTRTRHTYIFLPECVICNKTVQMYIFIFLSQEN